MEELKRCPFCGASAEIIIVPSYYHPLSGYVVKCSKGCCNQMPFRTEHDAAEAWNRREDDA
jgi:Lar family restriction alleviation protein